MRPRAWRIADAHRDQAAHVPIIATRLAVAVRIALTLRRTSCKASAFSAARDRHVRHARASACRRVSPTACTISALLAAARDRQRAYPLASDSFDMNINALCTIADAEARAS